VSSVDLGQLLEESGAVLRGHFKLTSGRHSDIYFEKFRVLEKPRVLSTLCADIAERFRHENVVKVAGPTTGGILIACEVARQLEVEALYVESKDGEKAVRRSQTVPEGGKVLVVDDVLTTGLSVRETLNCVQVAGAKVVGVAVLIDRSEQPLDFGVPLHAAYRVEATSYAPDEVPEWLAELPVTKPGSRPTGPA
jgi:orotate phosphoribosyltransferase